MPVKWFCTFLTSTLFLLLCWQLSQAERAVLESHNGVSLYLHLFSNAGLIGLAPFYGSSFLLSWQLGQPAIILTMLSGLVLCLLDSIWVAYGVRPGFYIHDITRSDDGKMFMFKIYGRKKVWDTAGWDLGYPAKYTAHRKKGMLKFTQLYLVIETKTKSFDRKFIQKKKKSEQNILLNSHGSKGSSFEVKGELGIKITIKITPFNNVSGDPGQLCMLHSII